jgi:uncharacterized protein YdaU (DUF1376 family)
MNDHPYMPLYYGDLLKQTAFWSGEERALLIVLWAVQWWNGPLPLDPAKLASAVQYREGIFLELWNGRVRALFTATPEGFVCEELEARRAYVERVSGSRRAAGRASGKARRSQARRSGPAPAIEHDAPSMFEQNNEHAVRTNGGTNGEAPARTPIQSNPIQSKPDELPPRSALRTASASSTADCSPSEPVSESGTDPPPPATATGRVNGRHEFRDPHSDWDAVVRNWMRRASKQTNRGDEQHLTRYERHKRRLFGDA